MQNPAPHTPSKPPAMPLAASTSSPPPAAAIPFSTVLRYWWSMTESPPGRAWQYVLATAFYNTVIGLGLSLFILLLNPRGSVLEVVSGNLLYSHCIGFSIHSGFAAFYAWTSAAWRSTLSRGAHRGIHILIPMAGVFTGYVLGFALNGRNFVSLIAANPRAGLGTLLFGLLVSFVWYLVMDGQTRSLRAEADEARTRADTEALQKQASEAELRALQAQIEPHFLFNTLANVQALIDYEPAKAKQMLETFIDYLRATLDASRRTQATLGDEVALVQRYVQLMQVRMGTRLQAVWDLPAPLLSHPFAPLLLQPLVENAIKYGLEPKIEGGTLTVTAREFQGRITLTVQDDGLGLNQPLSARRTGVKGGAPGAKGSGTGTGIQNVRARLQSTLGADASVAISIPAESTEGGGGCCTTLAFSDRRVPA